MKRFFLFILTNILFIITFSIIFYILEKVFWLNITSYVPANSWIGAYWWLMVFATVIWFWSAFMSLFLSRYMAKKMYNIELLNHEDFILLNEKERIVVNTILDISSRENINIPEIGIYISNEPNAFATWYSKNNSLVAVSTGLLEMMSKDEIEWVIWHEMAHVTNWDMVTMTLMQWVVNTLIIFVSRIISSIIARRIADENSSMFDLIHMGISLVLEIILSILTSILVMWFSRYREFRADEWSALYVWKEKMIASLEKLKYIQENLTNIKPNKNRSMNTYQISNKPSIMQLFSTHPLLEDRIKNLNEMKNL